MVADPATGAEDTYGADSASVAQQRGWISLDQHSKETRDQAAALLSVTGAPLCRTAPRRRPVTAAYVHDAGKAHKIWQDALCAPGASGAEGRDRRRPALGQVRGTGRLRFDGGVAFRHELASLLMLDGPLRDLLAGAPDPDLARYLVLAHHGKLRVQVRDPGDLAVLAPGEASEHKLLGLDEGSAVHIPPLLGQPAAELTVDLDQFRLGGERSWTRTALGAARPVRAVRARLPGDARAGRGLARQRRSGGAPDDNRHDHAARLPGLRPEPLASYLAGPRPDPGARRAGRPGGDGRLDAGRAGHHTTVNDIAAWLADEYVPTPVLSPWNSGSGFGAKDKEPLRALEALLAHPSPRLDPLQAAIPVARQVVGKAREQGWITDGGPGGDKSRVVQEFRNRCPDALLPWIDAAVVLAGEDTVLPAAARHRRERRAARLLHQLPSAPARRDRRVGHGRARSLASARDLIDGTEAEQLASAAVGQFDPAGAGGPGSSRFGAADSLVNPWGYVLLVEGALLFAASAARRHQHAAGRAAMPFTVQGSPDGSASGAAGEESRGEVWAPVWTPEFTLAEIKQMFAEARASWRGRPARRAVDFYAATRTLGVARGIDEFTRYGLQRRNGLAFAAVPLARSQVREHARRCGWRPKSRTGRPGSAGATPRRPSARAARDFETAHLAYARDGERCRWPGCSPR